MGRIAYDSRYKKNRKSFVEKLDPSLQVCYCNNKKEIEVLLTPLMEAHRGSPIGFRFVDSFGYFL